MFGAAIRAALTFVGGALFGSVVAAVVSPFTDIMAAGLPANHILLQTFDAATEYWILFALMSGVIGLMARAFVERQIGAGGGI